MVEGSLFREITLSSSVGGGANSEFFIFYPFCQQEKKVAEAPIFGNLQKRCFCREFP